MKSLAIIGKIFILTLFLTLSYSCTKKSSNDTDQETHGNVIFTFAHNINGGSLKFDTLLYQTSTGNQYMVNNLQYFISRVSLHAVNSRWNAVQTDDGIHYIDASDNNSCTWWVNDVLPSVSYDTISFIFGLNEDQNISGRYPNPPEKDMSWPAILGGGYHYMMLDLKWKNDTMTRMQPFNLHLGIGQVYAGNSVNTDSIIGFVQNYFKISLPLNLDLSKSVYHQILIVMNIEKWFDSQYAFNFSSYPDGIMQDQEGMFKACMNGRKAFSVIITDK